MLAALLDGTNAGKNLSSTIFYSFFQFFLPEFLSDRSIFGHSQSTEKIIFHVWSSKNIIFADSKKSVVFLLLTLLT